MIKANELLEYVELVKDVEKRKSSMEKISALKGLKEIMFRDQLKKLRNWTVSSNWVLWWWNATKMVHEKGDWKEAPLFSYFIDEDANYIQLNSISGVPSWIRFMMNTTPETFSVNVGHGGEYYDKKHPGEGIILDSKYFLQPDESKPIVTPVDVMFCELLAYWDNRMERYCRKAVVEGAVSSPMEAKPTSHYIGGEFFWTIADIIDGIKEKEAKLLVDGNGPEKERVKHMTEVKGLSKGPKPRCVSNIKNLDKKVKEYLQRTEDMLKKGNSDDEEKYNQLFGLYEYIDNENGAFKDDAEGFPWTALEPFLERWELDVYKEYGSTGKCVQLFLKAADKAIHTYSTTAGFIDNLIWTEGWEWGKQDTVYPAQAVLYALLESIKHDLDYLWTQVKITKKKELPKLKPYELLLVADGPLDKAKTITLEREYREETVDNNILQQSLEEANQDHICIDKQTAKRLFVALTADDVSWLAEKMTEAEFVNLLTLPPSGKKIKLHQLNQVNYLTKKVLFREKSRMAPEEWDLIRQLFDAEHGNMIRVNTAYKKHVKNQENFDKHMGISGRIAKP